MRLAAQCLLATLILIVTFSAPPAATAVPASDASVPTSHVDRLTTPRDDPAPAVALTFRDPVTEPTATDVETVIVQASFANNLDPLVMRRVLMCESKMDPNAVGDGGRSLGIAQYQARTFLEHSRLSGLGYTLADLGDPASQIRLMAWAFSHGRASAWSCAR